MGFNRRKMEDRRRQAAEKEAAARRATEKQILEDADPLVAVWNERQAKRMPMLFSPTIGASIAAGYWFLWARCPFDITDQQIAAAVCERKRVEKRSAFDLEPQIAGHRSFPNALVGTALRAFAHPTLADEQFGRLDHTQPSQLNRWGDMGILASCRHHPLHR